MKKILMMMAAMMLLSTTDVSAQGFLKKMKQKAQQAVGLSDKEGQRQREVAEYSEPADNNAADASDITVAQGIDMVPKRSTSTVTWDGVITPSKATSASALMRELPALPSAEKMARSTMEERDAYTQKIAAVVERADQLQREQPECSDAEMEALRQKCETKLQDLFGLTKAEMAILNDENAPESKKKPIQDKVMAKIMGGDVNTMDLEKFESMSEKEQEAYIKAHPEFVKQMQQMAMNAGNFSKKMKDMTAALNGYEMKIGKLANDYLKFMEEEANHDYSAIARKYNKKLQVIYDEICAIDDAAKIDNLYTEADGLLYNYRLEAAKEYRASLQRQIDEAKKFAAEYSRLTKEVVESGDLPACAVGRADLNAVIKVGNLLDDAYSELPDLEAIPVCIETLYELEKGWSFCAWECRGYVGAPDDYKTAGSKWPLLAYRDAGDDGPEYGVVENGKFRKIGEDELATLNKQADLRQKNQAKNGIKPPYGTYKSRSGKRTVEFSQTGELIINGMTTFVPSAFTAKADRLEWVMVEGSRLLKCTYKL